MERDIWQAVLIRVIRDLCPNGYSGHQDRLSAERWVGTYPGADFRQVCTLADIDPDCAHRFFLALCALPVGERRRRLEGRATKLAASEIVA